MKKVLVTGAAGFIGMHVVKRLKSLDYRVMGVDSLNTYYDKDLKIDRMKEADVKFSIMTLESRSDTYQLIEDFQPDVVIHLAAYAGLRYSLNYPDLYIKNNVVATQNLIDACTHYGVDKVIYASTSSVYAGNELPWHEDQTMYHHKNPYAGSKFMNETQFITSQIRNTVGLRFFTVYGPWGRPDMALYKFATLISKDLPIDVYNKGQMMRDFTYIDDIVNGIQIVLESVMDGSELNEIYNIGRGKQVNLMDFVHLIEKELDRKATINYLPMHPADAKETWADTSKLEQLGYKPKVDVEKGVKEFITWFKNYYGVN